MARLGHSSVRAAMMYQHASRDRDKAIAIALGGLFREARGTGDHGGNAGSGTHDRFPVWHVRGTTGSRGTCGDHRPPLGKRRDLGFRVGAGDGNRTRITRLEDR